MHQKCFTARLFRGISEGLHRMPPSYRCLDITALCIRRDHPRCWIEIKFCMCAVCGGITQSLKFHQNRLSSFRYVGSRFALSHCFGHWRMQQIVLMHKPWCLSFYKMLFVLWNFLPADVRLCFSTATFKSNNI